VDGVGVGRVQWRVVWPDDGGWDGRRVGWTAGGVDGERNDPSTPHEYPCPLIGGC